ncbi:MAG: B12-binding domain-containing radical SAM protein [Nitrospinales bacterium]
MGKFKRVALLKGQQRIEPPYPTFSSDLTEICHLGAFIEKDVEFLTIPVSPYDKTPYKTFERSLKRDQFDFVGISSMTGGYNSARKFAQLAKQAGAFVTLGGYHPTALTEDVLADPNVDAVIRGEGEHTLRELVLHGPSEHVLGLSFKKNGDPIHNTDRPLIENLDALPLPLRKIRPSRFGEKGDQYTVDSLYSSRGCIAKCTFCANDTMNQNLRNRSAENFVEELELLHDPHFRKTLKFWDSIFLFDPDRVQKIIQLMFKKNLTNFKIITESRSDDVIRCRHLMKDLKRVGFNKIQVGIESPDPATFKGLRKGGSVAKHERAVEIIREGNMKVEGFFIIGHSHETEEDIQKYPKFAADLGIHERSLFFVMTPYPGTQIYREYKEKNLIDSYDWDSYNNYGTVVHLENMERDQLRKMLSYCYGSTWGIPFAFKKAKSIPRAIWGIFILIAVWLFLYEFQGSSGRETRNGFLESLFKAGLGTYRKKRKATSLSRFFKLIIPQVAIQIVIDEEKAYNLILGSNKDEMTLEVRPSAKDEKLRWTATLDDFVPIPASVDMVDLNAFFLGLRANTHLGHKLRHCGPPLAKIGWNFIKLFCKIGWRSITPARSTLLLQDSPRPAQ